MPLVQTRGAASAQGFGEFAQASGPVIYIEDVFSCFLYTGNGSTQTITNNIDLSTKGGLVWAKSRAAGSHFLYDTTRGVNNYLRTNSTDPQTTQANSLTAFNTTGFSIGDALFNDSAVNYASWTFREQPKFFDVVTWTGDGTGDREISHNLGSTPGCIILKCTSNAGTNWFVYHRALSTPNYRYMYLQDTAAANTSGDNLWNVTSTTFRASSTLDANNNGQTFVAYLFAHDAGGFGLSGTNNVISCGSYVGNTTTPPVINCGFEPQWILIKASTTAADWSIFDNIRGVFTGSSDEPWLDANTSASEGLNLRLAFTSTGFAPEGSGTATNASGETYIYIAIRRGPMKVPTVGTQVYSGVLRTGTGVAANVTGAGFPPDLVILERRTDPKGSFSDRLRKPTKLVNSYESASEATDVNGVTSFSMDGMAVGTGNNANQSAMNYVYWFLRRYPSVFDEVCYTGTGSATTQTHNLGAVPELMLFKARSNPQSWKVYASPIGNTKVLDLSTDDAESVYSSWNNTTPTSSVFSLGGSGYQVNNSAVTYVAYLFATCAGVSKVGSYTGNGSTQTIDCGFVASGARFVLLKRTDAAGDWYTYDTARGMTVLTDPYIRLNVNSAEVATLGSVTTVATGFALDSAITAAINVSAGTYIFLAIA